VRNGNSFLVLEYMARGSLDKLLEKHEHDLPWHQRLELARGAAAGMQYLHGLKPPRIHRDLKSPNLLISDSFVCKVGYSLLLSLFL
jgi:serine/threonine protein kinase